MHIRYIQYTLMLLVSNTRTTMGIIATMVYLCTIIGHYEVNALKHTYYNTTITDFLLVTDVILV